ncbi:BglG family transcription antiterminator [Cohnella cellulosilytica]|uniref:BglG family transcription antiterminator n=1 Tax=Cohnella cellulosilytica TaxID=986710 RepID=A0ABW2FIL2_9BACL
MNVTKRQRQIIGMLFERATEMTVAEMAQRIQVSSRTVHRELMDIEKVLERFGITLVKKTGFGIRMVASSEQLERLQAELFRSTDDGLSEITPQERQTLILCSLLSQSEPIKLFALAHELQAAVQTIGSDLDELEEWVERNGLRLIRKRGYGIEIVGPEGSKRRAIANLVAESLDHSALFGNTLESGYDPVSTRLLALVGKERFIRLERALWQLEETYPTALPEAAYTELLIRLSIALARCSAGFYLPEPGTTATTADGLASPFRDRVLACLADELDLELPERERLALTSLFREWEGADRSGGVRPLYEGFRQLEFVTKLVQAVGDKLNVDFGEDRSLIEGLLEHMTPAMRRLSNGERIRNPLLPEIRASYGELFNGIRATVRQVGPKLPIPDEEVGYLTMHFGAALERYSRVVRKVRALLVCMGGIGSSKLLAIRINKELPQIELLAHISWFEAARVPEDDYDLIISTVDLPLPADQYFKSSPLLTAEEAEKLGQFIRNHAYKRADDRMGRAEPSGDSLNKLNGIVQYSKICVQLLDQFEVVKLSGISADGIVPLEELVDRLLEPIGRRLPAGAAEEISALLVRREEQGSQVVPDTGLALFHTRTDVVEEPVIVLFRFDGPIRWTREESAAVSHILLMVGPRTIDNRKLEVLSEISALLLEPDVIERLETGNEDAIKRMFSHKFERFLQERLA